MVLDILNNVLVPVSTVITLITASVGIWLSLREYRLKVKAEIRLTESAELESDIKLIKLFTEIMRIAHGRGGYEVSEKVMEKILTPDMIKKLTARPNNLADFISDAIVRLPVGEAEQDAAISAIWVLGKKHPVLKPVAIEGLECINKFKGKVAKKYLEDLKNTKA